MAEGSNSVAPATTPLSEETGGSSLVKRCAACRQPVKDHPGPVGQAKCMVGMVNALAKRVVDLECAATKRESDFREHEMLAAQRQEALLATIATLEERIGHLEAQGERIVSEKLGCASSPVDLLCSPNSMDAESLTSVVTSACEEDGDIAVSAEAVSAELRTVAAAQTPCTQVLQTTGSRHGDEEGAAMLERAREGSSYAVVTASGSDGFTTVVRKASSKRKFQKKTSSTKTIAAPLSGAQRVSCKPFHLSGLSMDTTTDDVLAYVKLKGVTITGCYAISTKVWGTASMKVFIAKSAEPTVLDSNFWPEFVKCREWMKTPPFRPRPRIIREGDNVTSQPTSD